MFELKKHVKERLIKRTEGIISLLLIVLLVPFYSVAAILEEVGRIRALCEGWIRRSVPVRCRCLHSTISF